MLACPFTFDKPQCGESENIVKYWYAGWQIDGNDYSAVVMADDEDTAIRIAAESFTVDESEDVQLQATREVWAEEFQLTPTNPIYNPHINWR